MPLTRRSVAFREISVSQEEIRLNSKFASRIAKEREDEANEAKRGQDRQSYETDGLRLSRAEDRGTAWNVRMGTQPLLRRTTIIPEAYL